MGNYFLEIGCEELPSDSIDIAIDYISNKLDHIFSSNRVEYSSFSIGGTPRRIYLSVIDVSEYQPDFIETIQGPSSKIAFSGKELSEVGLKFLESKKINISDIFIKKTEKGDYLCGTKKILGKKIKDILPSLIKSLIFSIPFSKTMRWGDHDIRFVRPIKYLLSLWNEEVLDLQISGVKTSNLSVGHEFLSPDPFVVSSYLDYKSKLNNLYVITDKQDRLSSIKKIFSDFESQSGMKVDTDQKLLNNVANIVEYTHGVLGKFDESFLNLPAVVLTTSMKNHQKFFPIYSEGNLTSFFYAISNTKPLSDEVVSLGYTRVLSARLTDALFFYQNDLKVPLLEKAAGLKNVVFRESLGSIYEKVERVSSLSSFLSESFSYSPQMSFIDIVSLCKADLLCEMVYEFPELQGIMGRIYSEKQGYDADVCSAIEDHYLPRFSGDLLPSSLLGKIVSFCDKLDNIVSSFSVGFSPTGNEDPYGLRRSSIGIINIIEDNNWSIDLSEMIKLNIKLLPSSLKIDEKIILESVLLFFKNRHRQIFINKESLDVSCFDAVSLDYNNPLYVGSKAQSLSTLRLDSSFPDFIFSYKRLNNFLKKQFNFSEIDYSLLSKPEEKALYDVYISIKGSVAEQLKLKDWESLYFSLLSFCPYLNDFFEHVMIMDENLSIRLSRLSLLKEVHNLFLIFGDFSLVG